MAKRKTPMRMCIGCGEMKPKKQLIRIVKDQRGNIKVDPTGKAAGRGAYLCCSTTCLETAKKDSKLQKSFKTAISDEVFKKITEDINEKMINE